MTSAEGNITHATVGRINVERGEGSVTLRLWQWSLSPAATMTHNEARTLIRRMEEAMAPVRSKFAPPAEGNHEDLA